jgi:hypothetical protein
LCFAINRLKKQIPRAEKRGPRNDGNRVLELWNELMTQGTGRSLTAER